MQGKERILLTCWGTLGEVFPIQRLARHLTGQGNRVHVCGPGYAQQLFGGVSASFSAIPTGIEQTDWRIENQQRFLSQRHGLESILNDIDEHAHLAAEQMHRVIIKQKISKVMHSWITPAAAIAAHRARVPSVRLYLYPLALNQQADPPVMPRWPRLTSCSQGIETRRKLQPVLSHRYRRLIPRLMALGNDAGLAPETYEMFPAERPSCARLALFDERLLLSADKTLDFLNLPLQPKPTMPPELEEFLGRHGAPILISLGSFKAPNKRHAMITLLAAIRSLSLPAVAVLGQPGPRQAIKHPNALILSNCSLPAAMPHCRLVIHHGGIGTLQETLNAGRVSLTMPLQFDQFDNARRLEALGLGHTAAPGRRDGNALASLIARALGDGETAARCKAWTSQHS